MPISHESRKVTNDAPIAHIVSEMKIAFADLKRAIGRDMPQLDRLEANITALEQHGKPEPPRVDPTATHAPATMHPPPPNAPISNAPATKTTKPSTEEEKKEDLPFGVHVPGKKK